MVVALDNRIPPLHCVPHRASAHPFANPTKRSQRTGSDGVRASLGRPFDRSFLHMRIQSDRMREFVEPRKNRPSSVSTAKPNESKVFRNFFEPTGRVDHRLKQDHGTWWLSSSRIVFNNSKASFTNKRTILQTFWNPRSLEKRCVLGFDSCLCVCHEQRKLDPSQLVGGKKLLGMRSVGASE